MISSAATSKRAGFVSITFQVSDFLFFSLSTTSSTRGRDTEDATAIDAHPNFLV
jgi:hypothetical protein